MWYSPTKRHLLYPSIEAWFEGEGLTTPVFEITDSVERNRRINEYAELRQHLFAQHVKMLSLEEQHQFAEGTHPSQSHRFAEHAEPFIALLKEHLASFGFPAKVGIAMAIPRLRDQVQLAARRDNLILRHGGTPSRN